MYCLPFGEHNADEYRATCQSFLTTVKQCQPELLQKAKIHLVLHLVDNMVDFGPCNCFNTERYIHEYKLWSNRLTLFILYCTLYFCQV